MTEEGQAQQDDIGETLKQAAELFAKAATDVENRDKVLKEVEKTLSKIKLTDAPTLAESPIVQAFIKAMGLGDLNPGQVKAAGTLAERGRDWDWGDVQTMPRKTFTPMENLPLTWNGLTVHVLAGEEYSLPEPFYNLYREHMYAVRQAQIHERWLMGVSDQPPDPNWISDESARVRANTLVGRRGGHPGGILDTGVIREFEPSPPETEKPVQEEPRG